MTDPTAPAGPCLLLDAGLTVVRASPAARQLLKACAPTLTLRHGRLHAPDASAVLNRQLGAAADGARIAMSLHRPGRFPLTLLAEPTGDGGVRITLRDPEQEQPDPVLLQGMFGLTPTEGLVAAGLAQGMNSAELARAMGVQPNTVQSHIKRVLLKSGMHRQSQFVSLVLRSVAMTGHPAVAGDTARQVPGLAQTGDDAAPGAGHSRPRSPSACCGCP